MNKEVKQLLDDNEMKEPKGEAVQPKSIIEDTLKPIVFPILFHLEVIDNEFLVPYIFHVNVDSALTSFERAKLLGC